MGADAKLDALILSQEWWSPRDITKSIGVANHRIISHRRALERQGHYFESEGQTISKRWRHNSQACLPSLHESAPLPLPVPVVGPNKTKTERAHEAFLSGQPVSLHGLAVELTSNVGWLGKLRRELERAGHQFALTMAEGHERRYCHVHAQCPACSLPQTVKRKGGAAAVAATLLSSPSLDAVAQVTLLRRRADGSLLIGFSDGQNEYIAEHVGTLAVGEDMPL